MATYTENYNLEKPALDEVVDINVINNNYDVIDEALGDTQELALNIGSAYNSIIAYSVGDYCIYNNNLYKCVQATSSGDSFNPAKWQICKVTDDLGNVVANPSGSATTSLTKLEVDGTIYGISGGGGGGSTVVVTPTLQSGTKVADIEVDNVTSTLYAPTPTEVEANPSSTGTVTLSKLKVGSTTYNVSQGGGSTVTVSQTLSSGTEVAGIIVDGTETKLYAPTPTNVIANRSGQATTELSKLTVGSTIYKIPDDVEANPTATGTTDLIKLRVGSTTYNIPSGGGATTLNGLTDVDLNSSSNGQILKYDGTNQKWVNANESTGSTVVWNQITQTGTKIATVSVDGTPTDVYAPTSGGGGATSLAGLSDVTVSSVSNGQVLKYDSANQKWINDNESGGTTVIANPSGTATDDLEKIQIGNTIYEIASGGISDKKDLLWEYSNSYNITLANSFTDYDFLIFEGNNYNDIDHKGGAIISSTELEDIIGVSGKLYTFNGVIDTFANYTVDSTTSLTYIEGGAKVLRVWGIKFGGGSSDYEEDILYNATPSTAAPSTLTLSHDYTDYDVLVFNLWRSAEGYMNKYDRFLLVSDLNTNDRFQLITYTEYATYTVTDETTFTQVNSSGMYIEKVVGIKFGGGSGGSASWTDVTGTLTAGSTSITLSDNSILTTSTIDVYTDTFGINPTNVTVSTGSVTLTFEAQSANLGVKVRIS